MPQGLSAHRPTAYQARPGGRPVSRQTGPSAQKNIPASLLEGPSAAGSAAHPRAEAADGSRMVPWFRCNRCTPSPRRLHPVGALVAPRSGSGCICCTPMRQLSTASPTVAAGPGPGSAPKRSPRRSPDAAPQRCCPGAGRLASCLSFCLIHPRPGPFTSVRSDSVCAVRGRWRTPVNAGRHCWKACWGGDPTGWSMPVEVVGIVYLSPRAHTGWSEPGALHHHPRGVILGTRRAVHFPVGALVKVEVVPRTRGIVRPQWPHA